MTCRFIPCFLCLMPLWMSTGGGRCCWGRLGWRSGDEWVELPCDVALEAADGLAAGLAFGGCAVGGSRGWRWSQRSRVRVMRCRAALACRLPPRLRRWRWVLPEEPLTGLTPQSAANEASW